MKLELSFPNGLLAIGLTGLGLAGLIRFAWVFREYILRGSMLTGLVSGVLLLCTAVLFIVIWVESDPLVVPELIAILSAGVMLFWKYTPGEPGNIWLLPLCAGVLWVLLTAPSYFRAVYKSSKQPAAAAAVQEKQQSAGIDTDALISRMLSGENGSRNIAEEIEAVKFSGNLMPALKKRFETEAENGNAEMAARIGFYLAWVDPHYMTLFLNPDIQEKNQPEVSPPPLKRPEVSDSVREAVKEQAWKAVRMKFRDENLGKEKPEEQEAPVTSPYELELTLRDNLELSCVLKNISDGEKRYLVNDHFGPVSMVIAGSDGTDLPFQNMTPPSDPPGPPVYSTLEAGSEINIGVEKIISMIGTLYSYNEDMKYTSFVILEKDKDQGMPGYDYSEPFKGYVISWHWKKFRLEPGTYTVYCMWNCSYANRDGSADSAPQRVPYFYETQDSSGKLSGWQGKVTSNNVEIVLPLIEGE